MWPVYGLEVKKALFYMHPDKSPGPDGMSAHFYQNLWHIVGRDITAAVLAVLNDEASLNSWNQTVVTLIPKVANPLLMKEFRLISLCNVYYKIISLALKNRLRPIMNDIIDEYQSSFVSGRLISNNIILGFETIHWMRNRKVGKHGFAALKLDMSKAYDIVEWRFLEAMMNKLGFTPVWTKKILRFITSVSYSFRINQEIVGQLVSN